MRRSLDPKPACRVLHITAGNLFGGIEVLLTTLARLRDLCPPLKPQFALCFEGRLQDKLNAAGVVTHPLGKPRVSRPWTIWRARQRLVRLLTQEAFDVVICHGCWSHALFAPVVRSRGVPSVFWAHAILTGRHWLERWARRTRPDLVLANSMLSHSAVRTVFGDLPAEVLYSPVPAPEPMDREAVRCEVRAGLDTPPDATVFLHASRIEPVKGHKLLLNALGRMRERSGWVCWLAGAAQHRREASYLEQLKAAAVRLGIDKRVLFLGHRSDVSSLLAAADVYCQLNTGPESFGLSFVEALHAGRPVVTTAIGGALEIVDESCGILVPAGDVAVAARVLDKLIQNLYLRRTLGAAGPARARQLCDPQRQITRLENSLARVIRQAHAA